MKFKRKIAAIAAAALLLMPGARCWAAEAECSAAAAVVMEASTRRVLLEKHGTDRLSMASTTKIMTALLALESERLDEPVTVTDAMTRTEGSSIYLKPGDRLTLRSLVVGLMLESGNDAALAIAITLDGSEAAFVARMNRRAAELGMTGTHFVTASGLDDDAHYTTARDMALLGCAAMESPEFVSIVSRQTMTVDFLSPAVRRTFYNHNRLLREMDGCIGIKTGFTKKSGRCLVSCCERDGVRMVAVTLNAPDDWNDHKQLMRRAFAMVEPVLLTGDGLNVQVPVVGGATESTTLTAAGSVRAAIPSGRSDAIEMRIESEPCLYAPVSPGRVAVRVSYWLDGECVGELPLMTSAEISYVRRTRTIWEQVVDFWTRLFGFRSAE